MSSLFPNSLYIVLFYLRTNGGEHKYHWMLLLTGSAPPAGTVYHATDANRNALDLYRESYGTRSGMLRSSTVVSALYVGAISKEALDWATHDSITHLMNPSALPKHEPRWTCRVWVETVLHKAESKGYISLPARMGSIERAALATADKDYNSRGTGSAAKHNNFEWLRNTTRASSGGGSRYRTDPMDIDYTAGGGSKPMQGIEYQSSGRRRQGGSQPMSGVEYQSARRGYR